MSAIDILIAVCSDDTKKLMKALGDFIKKEKLIEKYGIETLADALSAMSAVANDMIEGR